MEHLTYLSFIQNIIGRLSILGVITKLGAIVAAAICLTGSTGSCFLGCFLVLAAWYLDAFFLKFQAHITERIRIGKDLVAFLILVEIYRVNENGNNEVQVTLGYNSKLATQEAIKAVQKSMGEEAGELMDELDSLLGIE